MTTEPSGKAGQLNPYPPLPPHRAFGGEGIILFDKGQMEAYAETHAAAILAADRERRGAEPVAWIWHQHLGERTRSLRWDKPTMWDYTTSIEPLYLSPTAGAGDQPREGQT